MINPLSYGRQQITDDDIEAVVRVLRSDYLSGGPEITAFEEAFATYIGAPHAIAVANGSAALHLCAMALEVAPGQRWITSPLTFAATAHAIKICGGEIEWVDIDPRTGLMDLDLLEDLLEKSPNGYFTGVLPVHYAGHPIDMRRVGALADRHGLRIIEDACHAPGAEGVNFRCGDGSFADLAIFSFHPVKHLTTGEGGMITTANTALAAQIRNLRTHGIERNLALLPAESDPWYYEIQSCGLNYRMSAFQAALGRSQLMRTEANLQRRKEIATWYLSELKDTEFELPPFDKGHAWHLFVIRHPARRQLYYYLRERQIFTQIHYVPLHHHPYYRSEGSHAQLPMADHFYEQCLSLPMYPDLTQEDLKRVIAALKSFSGQIHSDSRNANDRIF